MCMDHPYAVHDDSKKLKKYIKWVQDLGKASAEYFHPWVTKEALN